MITIDIWYGSVDKRRSYALSAIPSIRHQKQLAQTKKLETIAKADIKTRSPMLMRFLINDFVQ